ncbi:unnamed protein product [Lepidochelys kempii]
MCGRNSDRTLMGTILALREIIQVELIRGEMMAAEQTKAFAGVFVIWTVVWGLISHLVSMGETTLASKELYPFTSAKESSSQSLLFLGAFSLFNISEAHFVEEIHVGASGDLQHTKDRGQLICVVTGMCSAILSRVPVLFFEGFLNLNSSLFLLFLNLQMLKNSIREVSLYCEWHCLC